MLSVRFAVCCRQSGRFRLFLSASQRQADDFPAQLGADDKGEQNFCRVSGKVGDDTGGQTGCKGNSQLVGQPAGSEQVAYTCAKYHAGSMKQLFAWKMVNKKSGDDCHKNKPD